MKNDELKPCPFCAAMPRIERGRVQLATSSDYADFYVNWKVVCGNCGTSKDGGTTFYRLMNDETLVIEQSNFRDCRKNAIKKWNRRADNENAERT